ncbi:MAG: thermosome subunit beta [Candidatus Asgardarchaeia archaeon]
MAAQLGGVPVLILKEGTKRTRGKDAMRSNIMAARAIAESIRTSLGPHGMDKMLVDSFGDVTITNDGRTILDEIEVQHPAAKMMVQVAKTQDEEVGDGTTTSVVLAGELLRKAEELLDQDIHPSIIVDGYRKAKDEALRVLEEIAVDVDINNDEFLKNIAMTSMISKIVSGAKDKLAEIAVSAIKKVMREINGTVHVDIDDVKIEKKTGGSIEDTMLIDGIVLDKEVVHPDMPKRVENAKIALIQASLEVEKTEFDAKLNITSPDQIEAFIKAEENMLREMVEKIKATGANVVLCQKGIDDLAQHFLAKAGILAVRRIKKSDMEKLAKATGARIITNLDDMSEKDLGTAKLVEERKVGDDNMVFVEGCKDPHAVSILVRGGTELVVDEVDRSLHDALCVVRNIILTPKVVAGGGAPEIEIAMRLRAFAKKLEGKEQLAVEKYAESLEVIPRTLAENAGLDPIDIISNLITQHENGEYFYGVNGFEGKIDDMRKLNVWEPLVVKQQALKSATEAATMILRIDDVIAASELERGKSGGGETGPEEEE